MTTPVHPLARPLLVAAAALLLCVPASSQPGTVVSYQKISDTEGGFTGVLQDEDTFGHAIASLGDFDGDGVPDLAVGDRTFNNGRGGIWLLFMEPDGTVREHRRISETEGGFTGALEDFDHFGRSIAVIGDVDGDGIDELAVGAPGDDDELVGGTSITNRGAVWVLFMNADATVRAHQKISDTEGGFAWFIEDGEQLGTSIAPLGDLDGDGVPDLAVGAPNHDALDGEDRNYGGVFVLFLNADGTVRDQEVISYWSGGFGERLDEGDYFGHAVAQLGDIDGDGIGDIAVGEPGNDIPDPFEIPPFHFDVGAAWILFMNADGTVRGYHKVAVGRADDHFGISVSTVGDLDQDGINDLVVGASGEDGAAANGNNYGALYALLLRSDGTVHSYQKVSNTQGGLQGQLDQYDAMGSAVALLGDLDGDPLVDLAVGVPGDDEGGFNRGAVWILHLNGLIMPGVEPGTEAVALRPRVVPNPLRDRAEIRFTLEAATEVQATLYDALGRQVAVLADRTMGPGAHAIPVDAGGLPSGTYVYRLVAGEQVWTGRVTRVD